MSAAGPGGAASARGGPRHTPPALFAVTYTALAGGLYFALGAVAKHALGLTPLVFVIAAIFFGLAAMTYVEGAARHPDRAGATVFARYGFNELVSFVAGWVVLLDYVILIAVTALSAVAYLGVFLPDLGDGLLEIAATTVVIGYVCVRNLLGFGAARGRWVLGTVIADAVLLAFLLVAGLIVFWDPSVVTFQLEPEQLPSWRELLFAIGIATIISTGLESATSAAVEIDGGGRSLRRLVVSVTALVVVVYAGMATVGISAQPFIGGESPLADRYLKAPMIGIAEGFGGTLGDVLRYVVAAAAAATLVVASNSAMLGFSRLTYSLARNRQIPAPLGHLHATRSTPYVAIVAGALIAAALAAGRDLELLIGIYAFGALLAITIAHASIIALRFREPDREIRYRVPLSIPVRGVMVPLPAVLGMLLSLLAWAAVLITHDGARYVGAGWLVAGLALYVVYRRRDGASLFARVVVPEQALHRERPTIEYGSILVPLTGHPIDDDIVQMAGRFAADDDDDDDRDEPTTIEVIYPLEVPMSLPLDARLPEERLERARSALRRAKAIGEDYRGVEVATATVRGRSAGESIVAEARRRGVEAIIMAAEEPSRIRGGAVYGGISGGRENFIGDVTRYVVAKAPCEVFLTAPVTAESEARSHEVADRLAAERTEAEARIGRRARRR